MNIQPAFLNHWKVKQLVRVLDDRSAPLYLIALWGHCQTSKAWVFDVPISGVASICDYEGDPDQLNEALVSGGWIVRNGDQITVLGWDEYNSGLVSRWSNGVRGGRPKKPVNNRSETESKPVGNQHLTGQEPIEYNRIKQDGMGLDKKSKSPQAATDTPTRRGEYPGDFSDWWASYPTRRGKRGNKGEAFAEWGKLSSEDRADVLTATANLNAAVVADPSMLVKDAQRFLRPPNKSASADPTYIEWLDIEPPPAKQRLNNRGIMESGESIADKMLRLAE